nr:MAG TPA: hypothetical protein [Bacteriophage sp.]
MAVMFDYPKKISAGKHPPGLSDFFKKFGDQRPLFF